MTDFPLGQIAGLNPLYAGDMAKMQTVPKSNGADKPIDLGAGDNISHATRLCAKAFLEMYEAAAKKAEEAIAAENHLHAETVKRLEENAAACRECGAEIAAWLEARGDTADKVVGNAAASIAALTNAAPQ